MMFRLFVLSPFLASTLYRDHCPIIAVNDASDAEQMGVLDLFHFLNFSSRLFFLGVASGACPR